MSVHEHKESQKERALFCHHGERYARRKHTDTSGQTIKQFLTGEGHQSAGYRIVKDEW
jgi:molybdopterin biosynthesis enzyme MoaB